MDFAEARMYENRHARFTAVDPLMASGKSSNPQTFNRYTYVMNSPMSYTDPSGMIFDWVTANGQTFYDSDVRNQADAERYYGEDADHHEINTTILASDGVHYTLLDQGKYESSTGVKHQIEDRALTDINNLAIEVRQGLLDARNGMPKGIGNFFIQTFNDTKRADLVGMLLPDIPRIPYNNSREESYGSATETGAGLYGIIRGGGLFRGGSSTKTVNTVNLTPYRHAEMARDSLALKMKRDRAAYTAGYTKDGRVAAGCSGSFGCAENDVIRQLGTNDVEFTNAVRYRGPDRFIEVRICERCQIWYSPKQFPNDVRYKPNAFWDLLEKK